MAFCPSCGAPVDGRYCGKCGASVDPGSAPAVQIPPISIPGLQENTAAALCYLLGLITGIIFLVIEPYNKNKNIRFHAFQSIFLNIALIIGMWIINAILNVILPYSFWRLRSLLDLLFYLPFLYMLVQTLQGKTIELPVIGGLAKQTR